MKLKKLIGTLTAISLCILTVPTTQNVQAVEKIEMFNSVEIMAKAKAIANCAIATPRGSITMPIVPTSGKYSGVTYSYRKSDDNPDKIDFYVDAQGGDVPSNFMSDIGYDVESPEIENLFISNVNTIDSHAFSNTYSSYIYLSNGVRYVMDKAFRNCGESCIFVGSDVDYISERAFEATGVLYVVDKENEYYYADDYLLYLTDAKGYNYLVDVPAFYNDDIIVKHGTEYIMSAGLNDIEPFTFSNTHIILPSTIEEIIIYDTEDTSEYFGIACWSAFDVVPYSAFDIYIPWDIACVSSYISKANTIAAKNSSMCNKITLNNLISSGYYRSDANLDGNVTSDDALLALQYVVGSANMQYCYQVYTFDANCDGEYTSEDALYILQDVVGIPRG